MNKFYCDICKQQKNPLFGITRNDKDYFVCNDCWATRDEEIEKK